MGILPEGILPEGLRASEGDMCGGCALLKAVKFGGAPGAAFSWTCAEFESCVVMRRTVSKGWLDSGEGKCRLGRNRQITGGDFRQERTHALINAEQGFLYPLVSFPTLRKRGRQKKIDELMDGRSFIRFKGETDDMTAARWRHTFVSLKGGGADSRGTPMELRAAKAVGCLPGAELAKVLRRDGHHNPGALGRWGGGRGTPEA